MVFTARVMAEARMHWLELELEAAPGAGWWGHLSDDRGRLLAAPSLIVAGADGAPDFAKSALAAPLVAAVQAHAGGGELGAAQRSTPARIHAPFTGRLLSPEASPASGAVVPFFVFLPVFLSAPPELIAPGIPPPERWFDALLSEAGLPLFSVIVVRRVAIQPPKLSLSPQLRIAPLQPELAPPLSPYDPKGYQIVGAAELAEQPPDLVLTLNPEAGAAFSPPLTVVFDTPAGARLPVPPAAALPRSTPVLHVRSLDRPKIARSVQTILESIDREESLHETAAQVRELIPDVTLYSSPRFERVLPLSKAWARELDAARKLGERVVPRNPDRLLESMGLEASPGLANVLEAARSGAAAPADAVDEGTLFEFQKILEKTTLASDNIPDIRLPDDTKSPFLSAGEAKEGGEDRRLDVELARRASSGKGSVAIPMGTLLRRATEYLLRVRIGTPGAGSIVADLIEPIDLLLPPSTDPSGWRLDVAISSADFTIVGPASMPLQLPKEGPSETLELRARTPDREGRAQLYLSLAYRGNVVQELIVESELAGEEQRADVPDRGVRARRSHSNTSRFSNLDELGARALSIGVGDPLNDDERALRLLHTDHAVTVRFSELMTSDQTKEYRRILEEATRDPSDPEVPRFLAFPSSDIPQKPGAEDVLRQLARLGADLYRALYSRSGKIAATLEGLISRADETIQILRCNPNQDFPWAVLYDYPAPEEFVGSDAPVCLGLEDCTCPRAGYWCARGFWGLRHRIEELIGGESLQDAALRVEQAAGAPLVALALGTKDEPVQRMLEKFQALGSAVAAELDVSKELLPAMWVANRAPIQIVLGHMATADVIGEPRGKRIVLLDKARWLQDRNVIDFRSKPGGGRWQQPRSLVMLLACWAGAIELNAPINLMMAFDFIGAAGVVGTECTAFSGFLSRAAYELSTALSGGVPLGRALTELRRALLRDGNPLGFVLRALGSADLKIAKKEVAAP